MLRRDFVKAIALGVPATLGGTTLPAFSASPTPFMLLIDGIDPSTRPSTLFSFLDPIVGQNIPVGCIVSLKDKAGHDLDAQNPLSAFLARIMVDYSGLVEIILDVPDLAEAPPYFRMRMASEAQTNFRAALGRYGRKGLDSLTLATQQPSGDPQVLDGVRVAGFRNIILKPRNTSPTAIWNNRDNVHQIIGGHPLPKLSDRAAIFKAVSDVPKNDEQIILFASAPKGTEISEKVAFARGANLGDAIANLATKKGFYLTSPTDLHLRSGENYRRRISVCVEASKPLASNSKSLSGLMESIGVPLTFVGAPNEVATILNGKPSDHCAISSPQSPGPNTDWMGANRCESGVSAGTKMMSQLGDTGVDVFLDLAKSPSNPAGLDQDGLVRRRVSHWFDGSTPVRQADDVLKPLSSVNFAGRDLVLMIKPEAIASPAAQAAFAQAFKNLASSGQSRFVGVVQNADDLLAKDEPFQLLKRAKREHATARVARNGTERDALLQDAKIAWGYIDKLTDPKTGLAASTAWTEGGPVVAYQFATMWDTASLILAIISAHSIGLIDDNAFRRRIKNILDNIAETRVNGLRLPKGLFSTQGTKEGKDNYNASDVARLLTALKVLEAYSPDDLNLSALVARWDIAKSFRNGRPQTSRNGRLVDAYESNYAAYIWRGFGLWDLKAAPPYTVTSTRGELDDQVRLLYECAEAGPIGAEPHLLEEVELGFSDVARAMADALYAAQRIEADATGKLVCVSETPLNRDPWFLYQGYQINGGEFPWVSEALIDEPKYKTRGFFRATQMISTKAAFLWAAVRPGDYSRKLLELVREKARTKDLGYASGVFSVSGRATNNYSDLNTNAVILQSLGYILNDNKPAVQWTSNFEPADAQVRPKARPTRKE